MNDKIQTAAEALILAAFWAALMVGVYLILGIL